MSSETAINVIETVKNKLQKYTALKQNEKVEEYLNKLHNTLVTPSLLRVKNFQLDIKTINSLVFFHRKTKIDVLVGQLASNNKATYSSTAKTVLKKWHDKNLLSKTTNTSNVKTKINKNEKLSMKRKTGGGDDDVIHSNTLSESQSSDDYKIGNGDQPSSSSTKKRKVLSIAEYVGNKKSVSSSSSATNDSTQDKLTDTQIEEIYARFNANIEQLAVNAPDLANNVNKKLTQINKINTNRNDLIPNGHHLIPTTIEQQKTKSKSFWDEEEEEDDDDDIEDEDDDDYHKQQINKQSQSNKTVNNVNIQQVKPPTSKTIIKTEDLSMVTAIASSIASLPHSQIPTRSTRSQSTAIPKKSESYNFLRSKQERQAIYSGKRTLRTNVPSLQDLCIETLKDHIDDTCRKHFNLLPYELVKPIIDSATPEQLYHLIDNNPDYADETESLWQKFCALHFKDAEREECESYYELYWRKFNEKEERLQQITELAKRKKAQIVDNTRQTKTLHLRQTTNHPSMNSKTGIQSSSHRQIIGLPPTKGLAGGRTKVKKPTIPPLLKKTLKFYNGKN